MTIDGSLKRAVYYRKGLFLTKIWSDFYNSIKTAGTYAIVQELKQKG